MTPEHFADEAEGALGWLQGYTHPDDGSQQYRIRQLKSSEGNIIFSAEPLEHGPTHYFSVTLLVTEVSEPS